MLLICCLQQIARFDCFSRIICEYFFVLTNSRKLAHHWAFFDILIGPSLAKFLRNKIEKMLFSAMKKCVANAQPHGAHPILKCLLIR